MTDGSWMGHEPDTYRYNGYGMDTNYAGPETYRVPPSINSHMNPLNTFDYPMRQNIHQPQPGKISYD